MRGEKIPDAHHVLRYVGWKQLIVAEDGETVTGVFHQAFQLRPDEEYLSVTWVEFFSGEICDRVCDAVRSFRAEFPNAGKKSRYLMANVGVFHNICQRRDRKVRILHEPDGQNHAHVAVRRFPNDDEQLNAMLVAEGFRAHIRNSEVSP